MCARRKSIAPKSMLLNEMFTLGHNWFCCRDFIALIQFVTFLTHTCAGIFYFSFASSEH